MQNSDDQTYYLNIAQTIVAHMRADEMDGALARLLADSLALSGKFKDAEVRTTSGCFCAVAGLLLLLSGCELLRPAAHNVLQMWYDRALQAVDIKPDDRLMAIMCVPLHCFCLSVSWGLLLSVAVGTVCGLGGCVPVGVPLWLVMHGCLVSLCGWVAVWLICLPV